MKAGLPSGRLEKADDTVASRCSRATPLEGPLHLDWPPGRQPAVAGGFYPADPREVERAGRRALFRVRCGGRLCRGPTPGML